MKNDFNSLYERFDELYTTYDDRKALKGYIESMSRKSSKEEVEVSADNLPDTILTFEEFKKWCNMRACDGQWSMFAACFYIEAIGQVLKVKPLFGRKRAREKIL